MRTMLIHFPLGHLANDWVPAAVWILAPAIAASMNLSPADVGLLITIFYIGSALGYIPGGLLSDRIPQRGKLLAATFWWVAIGFFIASLAPGFWTLALLLAIAGMGDAAWHPIATGFLVEQMPKKRGMVLGVHAMGGTLAEVGAPLAAGFLLASFDWRTTMQLSVLPTVLMGIVFFFYSRTLPRSEDTAVSKTELKQLIKHWRKRRGVILVLLIIFYNMSLMALLSMTPLYLQTDAAISVPLTGIIFAAAMLMGSLLQPLVGKLSDGFDRQIVFIIGCSAATLCALGAALELQSGLTIAFLIGAIGLLVAVRSGVLASAVDYASGRASTTLGFIFALLDGVGAFGALLAGFVGEANLSYVFILAAVLSTISIAFSMMLIAQRPHRELIDA